MTSSLLTARPSSAAIAWVHAGQLYVEIPCKDGPPYITRHHCTTEGLRLALSIVVEHQSTDARTFEPKAHPKVTRIVPKFTEDQRANAAAVLKKMGIT